LGEFDSAESDGSEKPVKKNGQKPLVNDPISKFFQAVRVGDMKVLQNEYANAGANVNIQLPGTKASALHYAAGTRSRQVLLWLGQFKELDYLLQDREGRLPSAVAYEVADDPVIGCYLTKKENEQARARGIDIRTLLVS